MKKEKFGKYSRPLLLLGELNDNGVIFVTCPEGHQSAVLYKIWKHELLFTSGAMAFLDGYINEAVLGFAAALERTYEFYIRTVCRKRSLSMDVFDSTWKTIARQSERQLGAFCFLFALETGTSFAPSNKIIEFRNKVIHQGYIPSNKEVYDFAEDIFSMIRAIIKKLIETASDSVKEENIANINQQLNNIPKEMPQAVMGTFSMHGSEGKESEAFAKWLEKYHGLYKDMCSLLPKENKTV